MSVYGMTNVASYLPENFIAGSYPIAMDYGPVEDKTTIHKYAPIVQGEKGIKEADADSLKDLIGIAAEESRGGEVVYYLTGEYFGNALYLPNGVTVEALKPAFRKLGIFLKELIANVQ